LEYIIIFLVIVLGTWLGLRDRLKYNQLKRRGIKVAGTIIANGDKGPSREVYRLGGNVNQPTVRFLTQEGQEIIGYPVLGFVIQHQVITPLRVTVFYDAKQPNKFCIDFD
jgi:hypothetical protein